MAQNLKFSDGEKVLCFHGPLLYEAKCIKSEIKDKNVKYFIHYSGWNKNWDEWVPEIKVLKYNDVNIQKQKELEAAHGKEKKNEAAVKTDSKKEALDRESSALPLQEKTPQQKEKEVVSAPTQLPENQMKKGSRTKTEPNVETEEEYVRKRKINIRIPNELNYWLIDDYNLINRKRKLLKLPARVAVDTILEGYISYKCSEKGITPDKETAVLETVNTIKEYFNTMLGTQLLYCYETQQYNDLMSENPDSTPSQLYGAFHLLRLFSKIGSPLSYIALDEDGINILSANFNDFLKYMSTTRTTLFCHDDYTIASPDYLKKVG